MRTPKDMKNHRGLYINLKILSLEDDKRPMDR